MAPCALARAVTVAALAALASGCDTRNTESFVASPTNAPADQPLIVSYSSITAAQFGSGLMFRMRVEPGGRQTCETFPDTFNGWYYQSTAQELACDFRAYAVNGRWVLFGPGAHVIEQLSFGGNPFGSRRPDDPMTVDLSAIQSLTLESPGFHATSILCARTESRRVPSFTLTSYFETHDCGTIALQPQAPEDSTLFSVGDAPMLAREIRLAIAASNDFPMRLAFSGSVDYATGRMRVDADCPLVGVGGQPVAQFVDEANAGNIVMRTDFYPSRLEGGPSPWQLHLIGGYDFPVGAAQPAGSVRVRGQSTFDWRAADANLTPMGPTADWIPLVLEVGRAPVRADRAGTGFVGHSLCDMARTQTVMARPAAGTLTVGQTAEIDLIFSQAVDVVGTPSLRLETGANDRTALYVRGSGSNTLTFLYRVAEGDASARLDLFSARALALEGGQLSKVGRSDGGVDLRLPAPGAAGSLGVNAALRIGAGS
jgi:hypothetical protein